MLSPGSTVFAGGEVASVESAGEDSGSLAAVHVYRK